MTMTTDKDNTISYKTTSFRAEESLLEEARKVFEAHGMSLNAAIMLYLQECVRQGRIPEAILNPGRNTLDHAASDLILRNMGVYLQLSDYGDPMVPAKDFVRDVVLEFSRGIFEDCRGPWIDLAGDVVKIAFMNSAGQDPEDFCFEEYYCLMEDLIPEKLPYDYAEEIVQAEIKSWIKADHNADFEIDSPFDVVMGRILKRSHLTLDELMNELVKEGAVEEKGGITFNRSRGKLVEDIVARLKEKGLWGNPEPRCGIALAEIDEGGVELAIVDSVSFRLNVDPAWYLSFDHPVSLMFEDLACSINSIVESKYSSLFDEYDYEVEDTLFNIYGACEFKYPPKTAYDECAKRYFEALESAEPESLAAKSRELAKSPLDPEDAFVYSLSIDMDVNLWLELYNRQAFLAVSDAVEAGRLPCPTRRNPE